ncbi:hypothetical protein PCH_Pc12g01850 [Penicillium rubens Wisconsin 54-1255]|uniref:Uncharacterized protein n=1 Tax=Penicillium rubens (strain ATCC 28089 / DSM 1075 / NRRL 1951 / Wisconsin 54-1255) TaxID=500485 RepID=B6GZC8_PENRW|nr:hypothetical protein PCH_Pc12g01850 [Penicillium rubens Wisconsin 54-1255]
MGVADPANRHRRLGSSANLPISKSSPPIPPHVLLSTPLKRTRKVLSYFTLLLGTVGRDSYNIETLGLGPVEQQCINQGRLVPGQARIHLPPPASIPGANSS